MDIIDQIEHDFLNAFKAREELKTQTLRLLKSAIKNKEIAIGKKPTSEEVIQIIAREVKQRKDSAEEYTKGNRPELAEKEKEEIEILKVYLPEQLSKDEIAKIVEDTISALKATSAKDMGRVMAEVMPKLKGKADGTMVSELVKEKLIK